jgi:hypothetical protein
LRSAFEQPGDQPLILLLIQQGFAPGTPSRTQRPLFLSANGLGSQAYRLTAELEALAALVGGCQKIQGQQGYYRAIAGMRAASSGDFECAAARMPNAAQRLLRGSELRKLIDVPRVSFESMMRKRARTAWTMFSGKI